MPDEMGTAEELARLSWLEAATIRAYDSVENKAVDEDLRQQLGAFRSDHARHLSRMHRLLEKTAGGVEPPVEFIDFVRDELSLVERTTDLDEALAHLLLIERANASFFADALASGLPAEAQQLVAEEREDEQRHVGDVALRLPQRGRDEDALLSAGVGGGIGVTAEGAIIPGAVPAWLPQSPDRRQMEADIKGDNPAQAPTYDPERHRQGR